MTYTLKKTQRPMVAELPKAIQQQIFYYLQTDNFKAAKQLRDQYLTCYDINEAGQKQEEQ